MNTSKQTTDFNQSPKLNKYILWGLHLLFLIGLFLPFYVSFEFTGNSDYSTYKIFHFPFSGDFSLTIFFFYYVCFIGYSLCLLLRNQWLIIILSLIIPPILGGFTFILFIPISWGVAFHPEFSFGFYYLGCLHLIHVIYNLLNAKRLHSLRFP